MEIPNLSGHIPDFTCNYLREIPFEMFSKEERNFYIFSTLPANDEKEWEALRAAIENGFVKKFIFCIHLERGSKALSKIMKELPEAEFAEHFGLFNTTTGIFSRALSKNGYAPDWTVLVASNFFDLGIGARNFKLKTVYYDYKLEGNKHKVCFPKA